MEYGSRPWTAGAYVAPAILGQVFRQRVVHLSPLATTKKKTGVDLGKALQTRCEALPHELDSLRKELEVYASHLALLGGNSEGTASRSIADDQTDKRSSLEGLNEQRKSLKQAEAHSGSFSTKSSRSSVRRSSSRKPSIQGARSSSRKPSIQGIPLELAHEPTIETRPNQSRRGSQVTSTHPQEYLTSTGVVMAAPELTFDKRESQANQSRRGSTAGLPGAPDGSRLDSRRGSQVRRMSVRETQLEQQQREAFFGASLDDNNHVTQKRSSFTKLTSESPVPGQVPSSSPPYNRNASHGSDNSDEEIDLR